MVPWYSLVGHLVGRSSPAWNLEPGFPERPGGYVARWWYGADRPHLRLCYSGKERGGTIEQARLAKTVKVHIAIAKWDMDQTVGSHRGKPWMAPKGVTSTMVMSGSLSTGSPAGHLNATAHGGSMYSQAHVNPTAAPERQRLQV